MENKKSTKEKLDATLKVKAEAETEINAANQQAARAPFPDLRDDQSESRQSHRCHHPQECEPPNDG